MQSDKMYPFPANSSFNASAVMYRNSTIRAHDAVDNKRSRPEPCSITIRPNDVLCGRGKVSFNHSGNRRFRHIISQAIDEYKAAGSKWEKSLVAAKLVSVIHSSGGRFLKQKKSNDEEWYELSNSECKSKVSHAIRDAIAATRQSRRPSQEMSPTKSSSEIPSTETSGLQKPLFRGTWSSNSLVSLTDDSEKKRPDKTSSNAMSDGSYSSSYSDDLDESSSSSDGDYEDDFLLFINKVIGPTPQSRRQP